LPLPGGLPVLVTFFFRSGFIAVMVLTACTFGDSQNPATNTGISKIQVTVVS